MIGLPVDPHLPTIVAAVRAQRLAVVVAPPGSGKSTRIPPALLEPGLLPEHAGRVIVLQPRRVAARAVAARIAAERGWRLGDEVGYHVRHERRHGRDTRLVIATEGILTRRLLDDPYLDGIGAVVLDEFHERSVHTDLALAMLAELRATVREDLAVVVMSATLDPGPVAAYLGGAPLIEVAGRAHPVAVSYEPGEPGTGLAERVVRAVDRACADAGRPGGDVLVFLPGMEEIRRVGRGLQPVAERLGMDVVPLHGSLPAADQDRALRPGPRPRIVLATNVAETSVTIEGVRLVVDSGLARIARHDPGRGLDRLELSRISRASADQRAGRAGREGPGACVRLWSPRDERAMPAFEAPELQRVDLAAIVLWLHAWGYRDPGAFRWFEPPPAEALTAAAELIRRLGAVDAGGRLTPLGVRLAGLPLHPRLGRLLIAAADAGLAAEGAALAALLSEKDIAARASAGPIGSSRPAPAVAPATSDLWERLEQLEQAERARFAPSLREQGIDPHAARAVSAAARALLRALPPGRAAGHGPAADPDGVLRRALLAAYPDRVIRRGDGTGSTGQMVGGRGVRFEPGSAVAGYPLVLGHDPREERRSGAREVRVRLATAIEADWLGDLFPEAVAQSRSVAYDTARQRVRGVRFTRYHDLVLRSDETPDVDPAEAAAVLAAALGPEATERLRRDPRAAAWLDRVAWLRGWMPELDLPAFDADALADVLRGACAGRTSVAQLDGVAWIDHLRGRLSHAQNQAIETHAPEALAVPSGNRIRLSYEPGRPPRLAARLQELFGWAQTPRLAGGRVPVVLELLGPNYRPVQVTDDLASFWSTTYHQVRKDLRARYPKHAWPEDPWTARAEARGRPRKG